MRRTLVVAILMLGTVCTGMQKTLPVSYVAEFKIESRDASEWRALVRKYDQPMLDKLVAEGVVLAWGLDATVLNHPDRATHRIWVTTADYAGQDKVISGFNSINTSRDDVSRYFAVANLSQLQERYVRSLVHNLAEDAAKVPAYRAYSAVNIKPGMADDWQKLFEKYERPVLDQLLAGQTILGYGVDVEDLHTRDPGWRWVWVVASSLEALDKVTMTQRKRPEAERATIAAEMEAITVSGEHRDYLYRTVSGAQAKKSEHTLSK